MQKYILTEKNIHDMAGRIRKFFNSCSDCGIIDYTTGRKNIKGRYHWNATYFSYPSGENVYVRELLERPVIHIELPVTWDIHIGSIIYFLGGNKIIIKGKYYYIDTDSNGKNYFGNRTVYSKFVDVYERETERLKEGIW